MKNNLTNSNKTQIPKIKFPESINENHNYTKAETIESTFKPSKSSLNVFNNQYDATISLINRQSSNIQLHNQPILTIPPPIKPRHFYLKKQSVFSFDIISQYTKTFKEENIELRESIKFLLKQIKKLKKMKTDDNNSNSNSNSKSNINSNSNNCSHIELFSKLTHELDNIKSQLKNKEDLLIKLKKKFNHSSKEIQELKDSIKHKRNFNASALLPENKEQIEFNCMKKSIQLSDLSSTTFSYNADNNNITNISSLTPKRVIGINSYCYIKKVGLGGHMKKETRSISPTTSMIMNPIIEKKLIMKKSYNCLYNIMQKGKMAVFNINDLHFSSIDYIDKCIFNEKIIDKKEETIMLNVLNGLYILSGEDCNQLYYFDSSNNTIVQLENSLYSHWKGELILYTNYLSQEKLICLCSNTHTNVEMYHVNNKKWTELPQMNNHNDILSRIDTGYLLLNNHYIVAFYGYDYIRNQYIDTIDFLSLSNPTNWEEILLNNQLSCKLFLKNHTVFKIKNETNSDSQNIYLLGGYNEEAPNSSFIEINLKSDFSEYSPKVSDKELKKDNLVYSFSSPVYEYTQKNGQYSHKKIIKYTFDCDMNIHIIDTDDMSHNILSYSYEGNWNK